jgi:hypothetical protein
MTDVTGSSAETQPVERFKPTSGQIVGYVGLALAVFTVGYVAVDVHTVTGLRVGLGAVFFAVVIWVTQLRPRVTAYPRHVVLRNAVRDTHVPLGAVDEVSMGQVLSLWVGDARYSCIGIGQSMRADVKARKRSSLDGSVGTSRWSELAQKAERANIDERAMTYQTFVVTRLEELVEAAKREHAREDSEPGTPRHVVAWPEVTVLAVSGLAFAVSLLV